MCLLKKNVHLKIDFEVAKINNKIIFAQLFKNI